MNDLEALSKSQTHWRGGEPSIRWVSGSMNPDGSSVVSVSFTYPPQVREDATGRILERDAGVTDEQIDLRLEWVRGSWQLRALHQLTADEIARDHRA